MKTFYHLYKIAVLPALFIFFFSFNIHAQTGNVGIGTIHPDPLASLDVQGEGKGVLINRLTSDQINEIINPPNGLLIYDTDNNCFCYAIDGAFIRIVTNTVGSLSCLTDTDGDTKVCVDTDPSTDPDVIMFELDSNLQWQMRDLALEPANSFNSVYIGANTGSSLTPGVGNVVVGDSAMTSNQGGSFNLVMGYGALFGNTTGSGNVALGSTALSLNETGQNNISIGIANSISNISGGYNTSIGTQALFTNTDR